jgi:hypothetical protein
MTVKQLKWVGTAGLVVAVTGIAMWFGEDPSSVVPAGVFALLFAGGMLGYLTAPHPTLPSRLFVVGTVVLGIAGGWYTGRTVVNRAFNDCVQRGESVRVSLSRFHLKHGEFPTSLDQLARGDLPGRRWLRGSILVYRPTPDGYELSFSDWLVTHRATERAPFAAQK